jgi:hypothetical protein
VEAEWEFIGKISMKIYQLKDFSLVSEIAHILAQKLLSRSNFDDWQVTVKTSGCAEGKVPRVKQKPPPWALSASFG